MSNLDNQEDAQRLLAICEFERVTTSSKWLMQVIDKNGEFHTAYFMKPPHGEPDVIYHSKLEALRAAIDSAIASQIKGAAK